MGGRAEGIRRHWAGGLREDRQSRGGHVSARLRAAGQRGRGSTSRKGTLAETELNQGPKRPGLRTRFRTAHNHEIPPSSGGEIKGRWKKTT